MIWPPVRLVVAVGALPLIALVVAPLLEGRLTTTTPGLGVLESAIASMRWLAALSLVSGTLLTVSVPLTAWASGGRPHMTVWFIGTGLRLGLALIAFLIFVDSVLAAGVLLAAEYIVLGPITGILGGSIAFLIIGGLGAALAVASSARRTLGLGPHEVAGVVLSRNDQPGLWALVEEVARRLRVNPPDNLVVASNVEPIVELGELTVRGRHLSGITLHLGLPTLARLSEPQLRAILTRALAYLRSTDRVRAHVAVQAFGRLIRAFDDSSRDTTPFSTWLALPARLWIAFVIQTLAGTVSAAEADESQWARALASDAVGTDMLELGEAALARVAEEIDQWETDLAGAAPSVENLKGVLVSVTTGAEQQEMTEQVGPPALSRLVNLDGILDRLVGAAQPTDARSKALTLNSPRIGAYFLIWLAFGGIVALTAWPTIAHGNFQGLRNTLVFLGIPWLTGGVVGVLVAREVRLMPTGVLVRSWWRCLFERHIQPGSQVTLRWTSEFRLRVGFDQILSLSDGVRRATVWGEAWPDHETRRLIAALRERNVAIEFSRFGHGLDDQRVVVVWRYGNTLLLPRICRDGARIVETEPIAVIDAALRPLSRVLAKALRQPLPSAHQPRAISEADLGRHVRAGADQFAEHADRVVLEGALTGWMIFADGRPRWGWARFRLPPNVAASAVLAVLGSEESDGDEAQQASVDSGAA